MIIIMNIIISLIGLGVIVIAKYLAWHDIGLALKSHLFILLSKLIVFSIIIGLFVLYSDKNTLSLLILSGMTNVIILHFIEGFTTQQTLLNYRKHDV